MDKLPLPLFVAYGVISPISVCFSLALMATIAAMWKSKNIRIKQYYLSNIFWMSFSDLGLAIRFFVILIHSDPKEGSVLCYVSACSGVFFGLATYSWYFIITFTLILTICCDTTKRFLEQRYLFHIYVWCLSIVSTCITFYHHVEDPIGGGCFFEKSFYSLFYLIPLTIYIWFAIILLIFMCSLVYSARQRIRGNTMMLRTSVFVVVFVVTWSPFYICSMLYIISEYPVWLHEVAILFGCSSGIFNFIVWFCVFPDLRIGGLILSKNNLSPEEKEDTALLDIKNELSKNTSSWKGYSELPYNYAPGM